MESEDGTGPNVVDAGEVSAAVYQRGSAELNRSHPEWTNLVAQICGPDGLVDQALAEGWSLRITGFVDSTGPMGPGTLNEQLQELRPAEAKEALMEQCEVPAGAFLIRKGGIGGDDAGARKVVVQYVRGEEGGN